MSGYTRGVVAGSQFCSVFKHPDGHMMNDDEVLAKLNTAKDAELARVREELAKVTKDRDHWRSLMETMLAAVETACEAPACRPTDKMLEDAVLNQTKKMMEQRTRADQAEHRAERAEEALRNIVKHIDIVGGRLAHRSATRRIAADALDQTKASLGVGEDKTKP